ncbi:MAG: hypothetical protein U5K00_11220 [Melioribacteraceae bacterium]|nr:hypothetical protein [Melioribacteraceae bacterium]
MNIETSDPSAKIPEVIHNINLKASASISSEEKTVELESFSFVTDKPHLELSNLQFIAVQSDQNIKLNDFILQTEKNKLVAHGNYSLDESEASELFLETEPINLSEVKLFLPDLDFSGSPELQLEGRYLNSTADVEVKLTEENQKIDLTAHLENINTKPAYDLEADIYNINAAHWLNDTSLTTDVNGSILISGSGTSIEEANTTAQIKIFNSDLMKRKLDSLTIYSTVNNGNIKSTIKLNSDFGSLNGELNIVDVSARQKFNIKADVNNFNLAPILLNDSLQSNINLSISGNGENFTPKEMTANISLIVDTTSFMDYRIDSLNTLVKVNGENFTIEKFNLDSEIAEVEAHGTFSQSDSASIMFSVIPKKLSAIPQLDKYESLNAEGELNGEITGKPDSINVVLNYSFENLAFQMNTAESLSGSAKIVIKDSIDASIDTKIVKLRAEDNKLDAVSIKAHYFDDKFKSDLLVTLNDTASAEINSTVMLDSTITISIPKLSLNISEDAWQNPEDTITVVIDQEKYRVDKFVIANGNQRISLNGILALNDSSNIELVLSKIDIGEFIDLLGEEIQVQGIVDGKLVFVGNISQPTANGELVVTDIAYNDYSIGDITTDFKLNNEKLNWDFELNKSGNKIVSEGFIPLIINADSSQSIIPGDRDLNFTLKIDSLNLQDITKFTDQFDEVNGSVISDIRFNNSLNDLQAAGFLAINNALLKVIFMGFPMTVLM